MDSAEISVAKGRRICYNDREGGDTMSDITKRALEASLKHLLQESRWRRSRSTISPRTAASTA